MPYGTIQELKPGQDTDFCWLRFMGYPKQVIDIMANDTDSIRIKKEFGQMSEEYEGKAEDLMKIHNIPEPKYEVWIKDSPKGKLYLKLLTRQEFADHCQRVAQIIE
jgi:hypothetical protein